MSDYREICLEENCSIIYNIFKAPSCRTNVPVLDMYHQIGYQLSGTVGVDPSKDLTDDDIQMAILNASGAKKWSICAWGEYNDDYML